MRHGQPFDPRLIFGYLSIPEGLARSKDLSPGAKVVYGALVKRAGSNGFCWPSVRVLGDDVGLSPRQIQRYLAELEEHELILRKVRYSQGHQRANEYHFVWSSPLFETKEARRSGVTDPSPVGTTDVSSLGTTDVSPRRDKEENTKKKGNTRASAPPVGRSAEKERTPERDASGGAVAAAEIVANAQGLRLPTNATQRRAWLRGAGPLTDHPAETIRVAVELKLRNEPERWRTKPLLPRYLAEDLPALLRELAPQQAQQSDRPDELYDRSEVMRVCREARKLEEARAAWKAGDWPAVLAIYRSAKAATMEAAA